MSIFIKSKTSLQFVRSLSYLSRMAVFTFAGGPLAARRSSFSVARFPPGTKGTSYEIMRQRVPSSLAVAATFVYLTEAQVSLTSPTRGSRGVTSSFGLPHSVGGRAEYAASGDREATDENAPVVSVDWLHQHLNDPDVKVLDASWYMPFDKRNGLQEYQETHIPGALFFDIDGIADVVSEMPHMLPVEAAFSAAVSSLGLQNHHKIIVYDGKGIFSAARVWWMFRAFGHKKVSVLDGGLPQWREQNYPLDSVSSPEAMTRIESASHAVKKIYEGEQVEGTHFRAELQQDLIWSLDQVKQNIDENKYQLVDARSKARFDGSAPEPRKGVRGGHVPGSACVPFTEVLSSKGTLLAPDELIGKFQESGVALDSPIVVSCGTGVTACVLALALHSLGKANIPVYDGSWTEWGLSPDVPVVTNVPSQC